MGLSTFAPPLLVKILPTFVPPSNVSPNLFFDVSPIDVLPLTTFYDVLHSNYGKVVAKLILSKPQAHSVSHPKSYSQDLKAET